MKTALITLLAACGGAQPHNAPAPAPIAEVPYEGDFELIFVQVGVDNAPPRTFLLDSGADQTLIDAAAAKELGLAVDTGGASAQPGGEIQIAHARNVTFHVGAAAHTVDDVWVTPLAGLHRFVGRRFDGLLGHAFLERFVTKVSYSTHRLAMYEPATFNYRGSGASVPVEIKDREAFVTVTLDTGAKQVPARLKLDTGSLDTMGLNGSFVQAQQLFPADQPRVPAPGVAIGGGTQGFLTRIPAITIGPYHLGPLVIGYSAETSRTGDAGTLGADVLRRFDVTFDYAHHRLLLEPNPTERQPFAPDASGLFGATAEDDFHRCVILNVMPGSAGAAAGLRPGDEITAVDGTPFATYGLPALYRRLRTPGPVKLAIRREGNERTFDLALKPVL